MGYCLHDAFAKSWDCLLSCDGCATSPDYARQCIEVNTEEGWGFVLSCQDLAKGVDNLPWRRSLVTLTKVGFKSGFDRSGLCGSFVSQKIPRIAHAVQLFVLNSYEHSSFQHDILGDPRPL